MFCDFMEVELDSKKMENWAFTRGVVIFSTKRDANSEILLNYVTPHLTGDSTFFCARNFERQKNRKNKLQNFLWTLIFRPFFEKHQKSVFFVLQVIEQNDNFWTLKHGVLFFSVFFQKFYKLQYLPEQAITFGTIELNWTRHFSLFLTNNDTEGVKQCFFVVNKSSPCFCD